MNKRSNALNMNLGVFISVTFYLKLFCLLRVMCPAKASGSAGVFRDVVFHLIAPAIMVVLFNYPAARLAFHVSSFASREY